MHGFRFRLNWEKEESDASPFHPKNAVEEAVSEKVHGGAMPESLELAAMTKERIVSQRKWTRMKRGKRGSHLREETGEKGTARRKSRGGRRRRFFCDFSELSRDETERGGENERGSGFGRGRSPLRSRDARRGERGRGGRLWRLLLRERNSGATVLGEGMNLTGGPHPSAARERGGAGWAAGFWAKMAEKRKGKRNPFLFFKQIFHSFSKWIFNQFDICFQNTHHIKECSSMNAT